MWSLDPELRLAVVIICWSSYQLTFAFADWFHPSPLLACCPESLQVVIRSFAGQEDVGHHGVEVEKNPARRLFVAVDRQRADAFDPRAVHHLVCDGAKLSVGLTIA